LVRTEKKYGLPDQLGRKYGCAFALVVGGTHLHQVKANHIKSGQRLQGGKKLGGHTAARLRSPGAGCKGRVKHIYVQGYINRLSFEPSAISKIAQIAAAANSRTENIGARRLHTVLERLLEELSFEADGMNGTKVVIDADYVDQRFRDYAEKQDLSKYIL